MKQLYVNAIDIELNIHDNIVNSKGTSNNFGGLLNANYGKSYNAETDYAIIMDIAKYTLKFDDNQVSNNLGYGLGINGLQAGGVYLGNEMNDIKSFTNNTFENWYRGTNANRRSAIKLWDDATYINGDTSNQVSEIVQTLLERIKDSNNTFNYPNDDGKTYNIFCFYSVYCD